MKGQKSTETGESSVVASLEITAGNAPIIPRLHGDSEMHTYGDIFGETKSMIMVYGNKIQHSIYGYSSKFL